jgi:hypothetical protein
LEEFYPVLKRIPKGARISVANKLSSVINACVNLNTMNAWEELFLFSYRILNISTKNLKDKSLTSKVKENISYYEVPNTFIKKRIQNFPFTKQQRIKLAMVTSVELFVYFLRQMFLQQTTQILLLN